MAKEETEWLKQELPKLVEKGLLRADQAEQIQAYYAQRESEPAYSLGFILLGITAALLVGSGIILVVANNWADMGQSLRTLTSLLPLGVGLIVYGYAFLRQSQHVFWREPASGFLMLTLAASLGLIAQTHQIVTDPSQFVLAWLFLSVPLLYLMQSSFCAVIYYWGCMAWSLQDGYQEAGVYWLLVIIGLPHLWQVWRRDTSLLRKNILEWTLLTSTVIAWFAVVESGIPLFGFWGITLLLTVYFGVGQIMENRRSLLLTPFQLFPIGGLFIVLLVLTFDPDVPALGWSYWFVGQELTRSSALANGLVLALLTVSWLYILLTEWSILGRRGKAKWTERSILLYPPAVFICLLLHSTGHTSLALLWANMLAAATGILFLREGIRENAMVSINIGMLFVLVLLVVRFFDEDWNLLIKGLVFIGIGLAFLVANILLYRRFKQNG